MSGTYCSYYNYYYCYCSNLCLSDSFFFLCVSLPTLPSVSLPPYLGLCRGWEFQGGRAPGPLALPSPGPDTLKVPSKMNRTLLRAKPVLGDAGDPQATEIAPVLSSQSSQSGRGSSYLLNGWMNGWMDEHINELTLRWAWDTGQNLSGGT